MKRILTAVMAIILVLTLAACGGKKGAESPVNDMALADIVDEIYKNHEAGIPVQTMDIDISDPNALKSYTGLDSSDGINEAVASEAMIMSQAYSLVLVRANDPSKVADIAKAMKSGIDTRKWICVEADDMNVVAAGNVVMLIMVDSQLADTVTSAQIVDSFKSIAGSLTVE